MTEKTISLSSRIPIIPGNSGAFTHQLLRSVRFFTIESEPNVEIESIEIGSDIVLLKEDETWSQALAALGDVIGGRFLSVNVVNRHATPKVLTGRLSLVEIGEEVLPAISLPAAEGQVPAAGVPTQTTSQPVATGRYSGAGYVQAQVSSHSVVEIPAQNAVAVSSSIATTAWPIASEALQQEQRFVSTRADEVAAIVTLGQAQVIYRSLLAHTRPPTSIRMVIATRLRNAIPGDAVPVGAGECVLVVSNELASALSQYFLTGVLPNQEAGNLFIEAFFAAMNRTWDAAGPTVEAKSEAIDVVPMPSTLAQTMAAVHAHRSERMLEAQSVIDGGQTSV